MADLRADVDWWLGCLRADDPTQLEERGWAASTLWRRLAVAELGPRRFPTIGEHFARLRAQSDEHAESAALLVLDDARGLLYRGHYLEAAREFSARGAAPGVAAEVARRARIFAAVAEAAAALSAEGRAEDTHAALELGNLLIQRRSDEARLRLDALLARVAATGANQPLQLLVAPLRLPDLTADLDAASEALAAVFPNTLAALLDTDTASLLAQLYAEIERLVTLTPNPAADPAARAAAAQALGRARSLAEQAECLAKARTLCVAAATEAEGDSAETAAGRLARLQRVEALLSEAATWVAPLSPELLAALDSKTAVITRLIGELSQRRERAALAAQALVPLPDLLRRGAYHEALDLTQQALTLDPDSAQAARWEALARLGLEREGQASAQLEALRATLADGRLASARAMLAELRAADGQPLVSPETLAGLLDDELPPQFQLKPAETLRQLERLLADLEAVERDIARQQAAGDYAAQLASLDTATALLAESGLAPGTGYAALRRQAEEAAERDAAAGQLLSAVRAGSTPLSEQFPALARLLAGNAALQGAAQAALQGRIAETDDIHVAYADAERAAALLPGPPLAALVADLAMAAQLAALVSTDLRAPPWAATPDAGELLSRLDNELVALGAAASPVRSVRRLAERWRLQRPLVIEQIIQGAERSASELAASGQRAGALQKLDLALANAPDDTPDTPLTLRRARQFQAALRMGVKAQAQLAAIVADVEQQFNLAEAAAAAATVLLPEYSSVPVDDLRQLRDLLLQADELGSEPVGTGVAGIAALTERAALYAALGLRANNLQGDHRRLGAALAAYAAQQLREAEALGLGLCNELEGCVPLHPSTAAQLAAAYRAVAWWRSHLPAERNDLAQRAVQALATVDAELERALDEAEADTELLDDAGALGPLVERLELLAKVRVALGRHGSTPDPVARWAAALRLLCEYTAGNAAPIAAAALAEPLTTLSDQVWPTLFRHPLPSASALARLSAMIVAVSAITEAMGNVVGTTAQQLFELLRQSLALHSQLSAYTAQAGGRLLGQLAPHLHNELDRAIGALRAALEHQINAILGLPLEEGIARLRDEVLRPAELAGDELYGATRRAIESRIAAGHAGGEAGATATATLAWTCVALASAPWQQLGPGAPVARLYYEAHQALDALRRGPEPLEPPWYRQGIVLVVAGFLAGMVVALALGSLVVAASGAFGL